MGWFQSQFHQDFRKMMLAKLGLVCNGKESQQRLVEKTLDCLELGSFDYTLFFQCLKRIKASKAIPLAKAVRELLEASYEAETTKTQKLAGEYLTLYLDQVEEIQGTDDGSILCSMEQNNPKFVLRNHHLYQAYNGLEQGDSKTFKELLNAIKHPYSNPKNKDLIKKAPEWSFKTPGCSQLSCSS